jgi:hypothetical protein
MKPKKVDKATQKAFEEYGEFQQQNDGLMNTLIDTMNRINCRLSEANRSVWEPTSKKYKLDPTKQHVYNSERKEITERMRESDAETQKDEEWLKRGEDMLKGYNKLLEQCESLAKFVEPKKQETRIRLKEDDARGSIILNLGADTEKHFCSLDQNGLQLAKLLKGLKEHDVIELVFKERG